MPRSIKDIIWSNTWHRAGTLEPRGRPARLTGWKGPHEIQEKCPAPENSVREVTEDPGQGTGN